MKRVSVTGDVRTERFIVRWLPAFAVVPMVILFMFISLASPASSSDCSYFSEDFSGTSQKVWTYQNGTWSVQNGKLNVEQIPVNVMGRAETSFSPPDYFVIDVDVDIVSLQKSLLDSGAFGIYPFTTGDILLSVEGKTVDGVAAIVWPDNTASFMAWDVVQGAWYTFGSQPVPQPLTSVGLRYAKDAITLRLNKQDTALKSSISLPILLPIDKLWLFAQGLQTHVHFDNVCAGPQAATSLQAPQNFRYALNNNQLTVSWNASAGATGYKIGIGVSPGNYIFLADVGNVTQIGPVDVTGASGTFYLAVKAYSATEESSFSNEISVTNLAQSQCTYTYSDWQPCRSNGSQTRTVTSTTPSGCTGTPTLSQTCTFTPSAPQYMGFLLEGNILSVAWKSVGGATGYKLGIGTSSGTYLGPYDIGNITQMGSVNITGVPAGTYYLAVKAYNGKQESPYSKEIAVIIPATKAPGRTDSGSVSLRSNRSSYVPGSTLELSCVTEKGTLLGNVDTYVAIGIPTGQPAGRGSFSGATPLLLDVAVSDATTTLFSGPFPVDLPFGTYALSIVLVYPGTDPKDPRNWASDASQLIISYSALSDVQKEMIKSRGNPDYLATTWVKEAQQKRDSWTYLSGSPTRFGFLNGDLVSQETISDSAGGVTPKLDPALFNPQTTPEQVKAAFGQPTSSSLIEGLTGGQIMHYAPGVDVIFQDGKLTFALTSTP